MLGLWTLAASELTLGGNNAPLIDPVRVVAALAAGLLLSLLAALLLARMKRRGGPAPRWLGWLARPGEPQARIRVVETRRASVHGDICLVSWNGTNYLIALTQGGAALLGQQPEPAETDDPPEVSA